MLKKRKQIGALLLAAALVLAQLGTTAYAEEPRLVMGAVHAPSGEAVDHTAKKVGIATDSNAQQAPPQGIDTLPPADGSLVKIITGWTFVDDENLTGDELSLPGVSPDNQADLDTVVSLLPAQISAEMEGEAEPAILNVTWRCPGYTQDEDGAWPLTGSYTFTAGLPEGYACAPPPSVKVTLGGISLLTINDRHFADGMHYQETGPDTVQLIGPKEYPYTGALHVPAEITDRGKTYAVTSIGDDAFRWSGITQVDFSGADNLTRIGAQAFADCKSLTQTVTIPPTVTELGDRAFEKSGITGLDLNGAANLRRIGKYAFGSCTGLTGTVYIPDGITEIDDGAFSTAGITGLDFGSGNNLVRIGSFAFENCTGLTDTVRIPGGVTEIDDSAFQLSKITGLDLSGADGLTRIGASAFNQCTNLTGTVSLPHNVAFIDEAAFQYSGITGLDLSGAASLAEIGQSAFYQCTSLTGTVNVPATVRAIGNGAFSSYGNVTGFSAANNAVAALLRDSGVHEQKITLTGGGVPTFPTVEEFFVDKVRYRKTGMDTVSAIGWAPGFSGSLEIPAQVTHHGALYRVTVIEDYAFDQESSITSLNLSGADHLTRIGRCAFLNCQNLTGTVEIPAQVAEIRQMGFYNTKITGLDLSGADSLRTIGTTAFSHLDSLTGAVVIPASVTEIGEAAFSWTSITGLDLSEADSLTHIREEAFWFCQDLTGTVVIPASVTEIEASAFSDTNITGLDLSGADSLEEIGKFAFYMCGNLAGRAEIPASVTRIGESAFEISGITEAVILGRLQSIGRMAFPSIPIHCSDPHTQLLVNEALKYSTPPTASWDGQVDVPPGAVVTLDGGISVSTDVTVGKESTTAIGDGITMTVAPGGSVTVETGAVITIEPGGTLTIDQGASLNGGGTILVTHGGALNGLPGSGVTVEYQLTVVGGMGSGFASAGEEMVVLGVYPPPGQVFDRWTSQDGVTFADAYRVDTTFIMPARCVTVTALYKDKPAVSSGGGSSDTPSTPQSGYTVAGDRISLSIPRSDLRQLADLGKSLTLSCDQAAMTFDPAALRAVLSATAGAKDGKAVFTAAPADVSGFPDAAKLIGARPVYDFTISYKDGKKNLVTVPVNFPAGSAAITLTYTPAAGEAAGSLSMVYVDGKGAVTWLNRSRFNNGKMLAAVPHFSAYGVAYKAPAPVFTDTTGHWAREDIDFVAARGLLSGTGDGLFSPDGTMTRGMFVTVLGRLAGVDANVHQYANFTDVSAGAYYSPYVSWAAQQGIVNGTGDKLFSPDAPVTREQMAVMLVNYAGQMGYAIPTPLAAVTFADNDKISEWAAEDVSAMQRAGIMKGKDGNCFDPQGDATRGEVSAVLRRFLERVIDPATASGWIKNDSGHWLYYMGGKALTGWQTIGKLRYYFNSDGVMHEGWKQDEATGKSYYWTSDGAAIGWREIDGKWYYFDESGVMAVDTKIDGYEIGPDGARKEEE